MGYWEDRIAKDSNDCWVWQQATTNSGYGACKGTTAHKRSYIEHVGLVSKGKVVRHTCNNKLCCNPAHLTLGTQHDNYYDMSEEKRAELHRKAGESYSLGVKEGRIVADVEQLRKAGALGGGKNKGCIKTEEHKRKISEGLYRYYNGL